MAGKYVITGRQQQGRYYAWDISDADIPYSRLATFPVEGGEHPPTLALDLLDALKTGKVRLGEGHRSRVSERRVYG